MSLTVKIKGDAPHFDKTIGSVNNGISRLGVGIAAVGAAATAAVGVAAWKMIDLGKGASQAASDFEQLEMQFQTLTKSGEVTADLLARMKEDAAKSPLSISDYANAGKTLLAFGNDAGGLMETLKTLADVSMGNSERFGSLALAFAQTTAAGRLMGQEVLQFVNAGFNPLQQISKKTGETMLQLKKRMEDGAVSAAEVKEAFKDATSEGGLFYQAIQKGGETTAGKMAQLKDTVLSLKIAFGEGLNQGVKAVADASAGMIEKLQSAFQKTGAFLGDAIQQSINGDVSMFVEAGLAIGRAIVEGIKLAAKSAMFEIEAIFQKSYDKFMNATNVFGLSPERNKGQEMSEQRNSIYNQNVADAISATQESFNNRVVPYAEARELFNQGVRGDDLGYRGTDMGKMLDALERIARAVDKPFPN
jgi:tape measure domain-containing protein